MIIDKVGVGAMLLSAGQLLGEHTDRLSDIDSRFGDGDHGITIGKISKLIAKEVPQWGDESLAQLFDNLGTAIMAVRGGSAGPLYGTMVSGLGAKLGPDEMTLDADGIRRMFAGSLESMEEITKATIGDKTMMDSLIPAVRIAQTAQGDAKAILEAAAEAAEAGSKASEDFISKYGRAKSYKEKTIGTPDAGAVSTALFIRGLANGV